MADVATPQGRSPHNAHETTTGLPHTKLAMWLFLGVGVPAVRRRSSRRTCSTGAAA